MRFAIQLSPTRALRLSGKYGDWPLALRLAAIIIPVGVCAAFVATWLGYSAATASLADSLEALPMMKAKLQAERMNSVYIHLRQSLERIAQVPDLNAQKIRNRLDLFFQEGFPLIAEFGFYSKAGNGFLLLRDVSGFREISQSDAPSGDYSPFQQLTSLSLTPGRAALYPAVFAYHPSQDGKEQPRKIPVIRMALPLTDGSGALLVGVDLDALQRTIGVYARQESPLRFPLQEGTLQVSYFFDADGWILFEMTGTEAGSFYPALARRGYTGDLGRPGYGPAFRPWGVHEDYWRMITEVKEHRSGSSPATAAHYSSTHSQSRAFLCYAPVYFSPADGAAPALIGGIAFFETSNLPLAAFLRAANVTVGVLVGTLTAMGFLAFWAGRGIGEPLTSIVTQLKAMGASGEYHAVEITPRCAEHQKLQAATNSLIAHVMVAQTDAERMRREMQYIRARSPVDLVQLLSPSHSDAEFGLVGSSPLIHEVREQVHKAARAGTDVLVWGETGTGKELVAEAIHKASPRNGGPFVSINCGALDENLLLDTLFGHVKGAFTEARADRKGAFLAADGGTLHLDEIGNASPKVQQSLLRALSVRRIRPLGTDVEISFNTRVVAATNVDLRESVRAGLFREDLYYRLAIISIETPPLRHRKEDLPELAAFCIREAAAGMGKPEPRLSRGALDIMAAHDWPGNVREFKNCVTRALAFVEGDLILPQHITLEQDAFSTYAPPLPPPVLALKGRRPANGGYTSPYMPEAPGGEGAESFPRGLNPARNGEVDGFAPGRPGAPAGAARGRGAEEEAAEAGGLSGVSPGEGSLSLSAGKLNERQAKALEFARANGGITRAQYEASAGQDVSPRTAQNDLRDLVNMGFLERMGAGPGTYYIPRQQAE